MGPVRDGVRGIDPQGEPVSFYQAVSGSGDVLLRIPAPGYELHFLHAGSACGLIAAVRSGIIAPTKSIERNMWLRPGSRIRFGAGFQELNLRVWNPSGGGVVANFAMVAEPDFFYREPRYTGLYDQEPEDDVPTTTWGIPVGPDVDCVVVSFADVDGTPLSALEREYRGWADEFVLTRARLDAGQAVRRRSASAEVLLVLDGQARIVAGTETLPLGRGQLALVPAGLDYSVAGGADTATVFRAAVPI